MLIYTPNLSNKFSKNQWLWHQNQYGFLIAKEILAYTPFEIINPIEFDKKRFKKNSYVFKIN